jgi:hypothetical protein
MQLEHTDEASAAAAAKLRQQQRAETIRCVHRPASRCNPPLLFVHACVHACLPLSASPCVVNGQSGMHACLPAALHFFSCCQGAKSGVHAALLWCGCPHSPLGLQPSALQPCSGRRDTYFYF